MARTRRTVAAPAPSSPPAAPVIDEPESRDDQLERLLRDFGATEGYRIRLWKLGDRAKKAYLRTLDFTPDLLDAVRDEFGRGDYVGRVVNVDNEYVQGGTVRFAIAADPAPAPGAPAGTSPGSAAVTEAPARARREDILDAGVLQLFSTMQEQQKITSAMLERFAKPDRPAFDVVALAGIFVPIVLELIKGSRSKLTADEIAAAIEAKLPKQGNSGREMLTMLRDVLALQEELGGGRGDVDPVTESIRTILPALAQAFGSRNGNGANGEEPAPPAPAIAAIPPAGATSPASPPPPPSSASHAPMTERAWVARLRPHAEQLARVAATGRDPRHFAESILTFFMSDADKGLLRELIAHEDATQQIAAAFPAIATYPSWLEEFVDESRYVLGLLVDDPDDTPAPPNGKPPRAAKTPGR